MQSQTETTIDRSFDQTAVHVHERGRVCHACLIGLDPNADTAATPAESPVNDVRPAGVLNKPVSPAIYQFRIKLLETENHDLTNQLREIKADRDKAVHVISLFENLVKNFAVHVDRLYIELDSLNNQPTELKEAA